MYKVSFNKERLKNHIRYDWWKYVVGIFITMIAWSMISNIVKPGIPADKKIDISLVGDYALVEQVELIENNIKKDFPDLLEVTIDNIVIGDDLEFGYAGFQKLAVTLRGHVGDIFILRDSDFHDFAEQGYFLALDDFIEENKDVINVEELDQYRISISEETNITHYYGIPMAGNTLFNPAGYDTKDKVMVVAIYSKNQETARDILKWILNGGKGDYK